MTTTLSPWQSAVMVNTHDGFISISMCTFKGVGINHIFRSFIFTEASADLLIFTRKIIIWTVWTLGQKKRGNQSMLTSHIISILHTIIALSHTHSMSRESCTHTSNYTFLTSSEKCTTGWSHWLFLMQMCEQKGERSENGLIVEWNNSD